MAATDQRAPSMLPRFSTLNLTMRQIWMPTFDPAPFQAGSVCADSFFTCTQYKEFWYKMLCAYIYYRRGLAFLSVSDPNSARLLSFQSYFLALTKPAMSAADLRGWVDNKKQDLLLFDEQRKECGRTMECGWFYYNRAILSMRSRCGPNREYTPFISSRNAPFCFAVYGRGEAIPTLQWPPSMKRRRIFVKPVALARCKPTW